MAIQHRRCKSIKEAGYHAPAVYHYCTYPYAKEEIEALFEDMPELMSDYTDGEHELTIEGSTVETDGVFTQDYLLDDTDNVTIKIMIEPVADYNDPDIIKTIQDDYIDQEHKQGYKPGDKLYYKYDIDYILNGKVKAESLGTIHFMDAIEYDFGLLSLIPA